MSNNLLRVGSAVVRHLRDRQTIAFGLKVCRNESHRVAVNGVRTASGVSIDSSKPFAVLPPLMNITPKDFGLPFMTAFKVNLFLKPYVDKSFDQKAFLESAKKVMTRLSTHLANNDIESIRKYVTDEAFQEISQNYSNYSAEQKLKLKVNKEDILYCLPFSVDIETQSESKSIVKIMVFFDVLCNIEELKSGFKEDMIQYRDDLIKENKLHDIVTYMKSFEPALESKCYCFYQFVREYEKGSQTEWKVNKMAHYMSKDIWNLETIFK